MRFIYLLKNNLGFLICGGWLAITLVSVSFSQPVAAQTGPSPVGVRWALWLGQPVTALTLFDQPALPASRLVAAGPTATIAIDPHSPAIIWNYANPDQTFGPPPSRRNILYLYTTAVDVLTGETLWVMPITAQGPMLLSDETLYLVGRTITLAANPQTGEIFWQTPTLDQGPIVAGGEILYIVGGHTVWAIDRENGGMQWSTSVEITPEVEPFLLSDKLIIHDQKYKFMALNIHTGQAGRPLPFHHLIGHNPATGTIYGLATETGNYLPGQALAFDPAGSQALWDYPATDPHRIYLAPPLTPHPKPLFDGNTIYAVDQDHRVVALDAAGGLPRWISEPLLKIGSSQAIYQVGHNLVIPGDDQAPSYLFNIATGEIRAGSDFFGKLAGVAANRFFLEGVTISPWDQDQLDIPKPLYNQDYDNMELSRLNLREAETGRLLLGNLILPQAAKTRAKVTPPVPLVADERGFIYLAHDEFIYAVGPADPTEAVATAKKFLAGGDYRSASQTLSLLKTTDEPGYSANQGEAIAAEALQAWLAEADLLLAQGPDAISTFISSPALRHAVGILQIREAQAHLQYLHAHLRVNIYISECEYYCPPVDDLPEVRQLQEKFGNTVWADRLEPLLAAKRNQVTPGITLNGALHLKWYYFPFILPALLFLVAVSFNRRRTNIYRAGLTAVLTWWGSLSYLFWATSREFMSRFQSLSFGLEIALVGGLPLTVWLLTRSKAYTVATFGLSLVYIFVRWQLMPLPRY